MKKLLFIFLVILMQFIFVSVPTVHAYSNPVTVPLGTVSNFAALAATAVSSPTGGTVLNNGDLGINAGCTDFPAPCTTPGANGSVVNGSIQNENGVATTGQTDATAAALDIGGRSSNETIAGGLLGGLTLSQGVYTVPDAVTNLTGDLTLNGNANSVFIFHATSTLITATGSRVLLTGGAQACNVFWKVDSSATFNGTTTMVGTVLAATSVTFPGGGANLAGRVVAQSAAITFNNTTVNNSSCASPTPTPTPTSSSSSSSSGGSAGVEIKYCPPLNSQIVAPTIIESKRMSPTSIFISWGPYSGTDKFNVQYGFEKGNWWYNTDVTGFSVTINSLPANQPIWFQVSARNECLIGAFGQAKLVGSPRMPSTGFAPSDNIPWCRK